MGAALFQAQGLSVGEQAGCLTSWPLTFLICNKEKLICLLYRAARKINTIVSTKHYV